MTIVDNKLQVAKIRLTYILTFISGSVLVVYSIFSKDTPELKVTGFIMGILLLLTFLYLLVIKPEYIFFAIQNNDKLVIKNYTAFPIFRRYKAYEIPINLIFDYEIKKALFNQIVFVRITVKKKNQVGKYPWLSFSIVPNKDFKKLMVTIDKLVPKENRHKE